MNQIWETINQKAGLKEPFLFVIDFECNRAIIEDLPVESTALLIDFPTYRNVNYPRMSVPYFFKNLPQSFEHYQQQFDAVMQHLIRGDSFLVNLTSSTPIETSLGLKMLFYEANAKYRLYIPGRFTVFSPETFIKIVDGMIYSYPMKGTIDAAFPDAESQLLNNQKEIDEHNTIVDLIRNDLNSVASAVKVSRYRYIDRIETCQKTLLQVSSEVQGVLPENWHSQLGDILQKLLPAGSICGAPRPKTLEIIKSVEDSQRGYYTGVMGVFDGTTVDSSVMIRFVEQTDGGLVYRSGGGITVNSSARDEFQELIDKVYVPTA